MDLKQTKILLNEFAKKVVADAKGILASQGKDGRLSNSLKHRTKTKKGSIILEFLGTDYANFVDQGVRGADPSRVSPNAKITGQQAPNSKFKFGSGTSRGTFDKFVKRMSDFAKQRNIRLRVQKGEKGPGQFKKGGYEAMGYVIAKNIYSRGLKPSLFFTKAFEKHFKELNGELLEAYKVDILKEIKVE